MKKVWVGLSLLGLLTTAILLSIFLVQDENSVEVLDPFQEEPIIIESQETKEEGTDEIPSWWTEDALCEEYDLGCQDTYQKWLQMQAINTGESVHFIDKQTVITSILNDIQGQGFSVVSYLVFYPDTDIVASSHDQFPIRSASGEPLSPEGILKSKLPAGQGGARITRLDFKTPLKFKSLEEANNYIAEKVKASGGVRPQDYTKTAQFYYQIPGEPDYPHIILNGRVRGADSCHQYMGYLNLGTGDKKYEKSGPCLRY